MENLMNLEALQNEMEDEMVSLGEARYQKEVKRSLSSVKAGKALRARALEPMAEAIEAYRANPKLRRKGMRYIADIDAHVLADLTMRRVLDAAAKHEALIKTCKAIAKAVEWHDKDAKLRAASVAIWNKTQERLTKTNNPEFRRKSIDGTVAGIKRWAQENAPELASKLDQVQALSWDIDTQVEVGSALIDLFSQSTKLVTTDTLTRGKRDRKTFVRLTEGTEEWLREQHEYHAIMRPVHLPMIVPPRDWAKDDEGNITGGYLSSSKASVDFVKSNAQSLELDKADMQDCFDAVNLIQRTGWRVNRSVFDVMFRVWNTGSGIGKVPPKYFEDGERRLPELSPRLKDMTPEARREDKEGKTVLGKRRAVHEYNSDLRLHVKNFGALMNTATRFATYPVFYHPYKLDWRQRAYPVSVFLNPQGDQFDKGLIEFAEGKRMGDSENAGAWLAIHGANCYGIDKVAFEERIEWVKTFTASILESALDPFGCEFWQQADKPWPFLAFCMEWAGYLIAGDDFETHLPVALDGSNSGLQHLSAMLKDAEGARVTCVAPGPKPEDIYQQVADSVEATLRGMDEDDDGYVALWRGKVSRKIVKQPTMTYAYSATESGMRDQIKAALTAADEDSETRYYLPYTTPTQSNRGASDFLAKYVRQAIESRMTKAALAMRFLQDLARTVSKTSTPMRWITPIGVPVVQYYPATTSKRKDIYIDGQRHQLKINYDAPNKLDKRRATAGVSPNFVHSMDSTHLLWTTLNCNDEYGIEDFAMIHDSFGTHATACDELASATREMFVALYDEDRLTTLRRQVELRLAMTYPKLIEELPDVPAFGTFDINTVRKSDYFFA